MTSAMAKIDPRIVRVTNQLTAARNADRKLTQSVVAVACNVDQGLISRLLAGKIRAYTSRIIRIEKYVSQISVRDVPAGLARIEAAVSAYLDEGGSEELLCKQIELLNAVRANRT